MDESLFCHGLPRLEEMVQIPRQLDRRAGQPLNRPISRNQMHCAPGFMGLGAGQIEHPLQRNGSCCDWRIQVHSARADCVHSARVRWGLRRQQSDYTENDVRLFPLWPLYPGLLTGVGC